MKDFWQKMVFSRHWYRISQQKSFDFYDDPQIQNETPAQKDQYFSEWIKDQGKIHEVLEELLENVTGYHNIIQILQKWGFEYREVNFPTKEKILLVEMEDITYVLDDLDYVPTIKEVNQWVSDIRNYGRIDYYIPVKDFSEEFWDGVADGSAVYHATTEENIEEIKKHGLLPKNKTRGISNRGTGDAVFTSDNPDDISSYGDFVLKINLGDMKRDGYMPPVEQEDPIEEALREQSLAHMVGIDDYDITSDLYNEGIYESTLVFRGHIPAKYLSVYNG